MLFEFPPCPKSLLTQLTVMNVNAGVTTLVNGQIIRLPETLTALFTPEWPVVGVRDHVPFQFVSVPQHLATLMALNTTLAGMQAHVNVAMLLRFECVSANGANNVPGRCMLHHVSLQLKSFDECLLAHIAFMRSIVELLLVPAPMFGHQ